MNRLKGFWYAGFTMAEVVDALSTEYGWRDSLSNFSAKLSRESLRYKAARAMRSEIAALKKAVDRNKASTLRQLELEKKVQELDDLQQTMDAIPAEIIAIYNDPKPERKELIAIK